MITIVKGRYEPIKAVAPSGNMVSYRPTGQKHETRTKSSKEDSPKK